jgi:hypothetical protein
MCRGAAQRRATSDKVRKLGTNAAHSVKLGLGVCGGEGITAGVGITVGVAVGRGV